jgi:hypothetical protein
VPIGEYHEVVSGIGPKAGVVVYVSILGAQSARQGITGIASRARIDEDREHHNQLTLQGQDPSLDNVWKDFLQ